MIRIQGGFKKGTRESPFVRPPRQHSFVSARMNMSGPVRNILNSRLLILALIAIIGNGSDESQFVFCMGGPYSPHDLSNLFSIEEGGHSPATTDRNVSAGSLEAKCDFKFIQMRASFASSSVVELLALVTEGPGPGCTFPGGIAHGQ